MTLDDYFKQYENEKSLYKELLKEVVLENKRLQQENQILRKNKG